MSTQAQNIFDAKKAGQKKASQDAYELAERTAISKDQDWTFGATIYTFDDNSRVRFCGPDVELYTLIDELARKAARLASYDNTDTLALEDAVFLAVCGNAEQLAADGLLTASDDWSSTGTPANGSRAQALYPNFADPTALGEWEGFDLESVQKVCQGVMNVARILCKEYEIRETK